MNNIQNIENQNIEKQNIENNNEKKGEENIILPVLKQRTKKNKYFFNEIKPWFEYYKNEINHLYRRMLKVCKYNNFTMTSNHELFSDFVITLFHNSEKKRLII